MTPDRDNEHLLFYFAYKTYITTADEIIEQYGMQRQHHRFLFFICMKPGITQKELLQVLEISKQGSHNTLKVLKEKALIKEKPASKDKRLKELHPTPSGYALIEKLNQAQRDLMDEIFSEHGYDWHKVMEGLSQKREGFSIIMHEKES
ncbi:MarR family winged helix-turn-helix transcriptional regulator [Macrococcoides bohemicum]|uniref:MarR family winged helix-turn-helix transcriptional regulator n=1 Tax=Macrococcoides bohemicum TaxID=1903056 RepID=A0AAJ4P7D8_9STAP|nr:helix-turn-helix domain-containing protein [Macrococcus bohemicus]QYA41663.1 MarR family winged helix-turn-helix transcriptional regulator [Macrococcus bohemicus]TDL40776.1 MarR family transcriptional regulator [Macrococcus bohemicus]